MAGKTASIKISLDSGLKSGLKDAGKAGEAAANSLGKAWDKALSGCVKGGLDAVKGAFSTIKSTVGSIAGIAGGIGIAELARGAQTTQGTFRKLAFEINAGTRAGIDWRSMLAQAQKDALATGQTTEDLGKTMQQVFTETGDLDFTRKSIRDIGVAATGSHQPIETMGRLAGTLNEKFGVTADEIGDALSTVVGLGTKGGISIEDMGEKLGVIGAYAKEAGLSGTEGFGKVVALMNLADNSTGNLKKGISAVGGILDTLGTKASSAKTFMKLGIDPSKAKGDVTAQIGQILQATKGNKDKLAVAFQGEQLKLLVDLGKTYSKAFDETTGSVKTKTDAATTAYQDALKKAGASSVTFADLQREASNELETGPKRMEMALEKLRQAFLKPEVQAAIEKLMGILPKFADVIAGVVGFAAEHPAAAGALAVAGIGAQGAGSSIISSLISSAFATGGKGAADSIAGAMKTNAPAAGIGFAGQAVAVLAAAGIGYSIGEAITSLIDAQLNKPHFEQAVDQTGQDIREDFFGQTKFVTYGKDEKGNTVAKESDVRTLNPDGNNVITDALSRAFNAAQKKAEIGTTLPEVTVTGKKGGAAAPAAPPLDPALLAAMLAAKTLRVEVTNPDAIRSGGGGGGSSPGSPLPGNVPRS